MMGRETVLVTGGAGYIGGHTAKALAMAGYLPVVYDNLVSGHERAVRWGPFVRGDILDRAALGDVISAYGPRAIIHFAGFASVGQSMDDPGLYYRNNVAGSLSLLEAARDHGIEQLVFSSSCAVYGVPHHTPIVESARTKPISPYGQSKLMVERLLQDFSRAHGLRSISLRYFNAAGADPDLEIGEDHDPETHLIPLVLDAASGRRRDVTILGSNYRTPDGTCIRDYVHVSDLAEGHLRALQALKAGAPTSVYNLGCGLGFSVREVIAAAERITGLQVPVSYGERRAGDPPILVGDCSMACRDLGWAPRYADLDVMLRTAWSWHQKLHSSVYSLQEPLQRKKRAVAGR